MTSSPDDRTDQVDDPETPPAKATAKRTTAGAGAAAAKKPSVKRAPTTGKPAAKTAAAKKTTTAKRPTTTKRPATATAARTAAKSAADKAAANAEVVIEPVTSKDATAGEPEPTTTPAKKTTAAARAAAARNTAARGGATTPASSRAKAATAKPTAAKTPAKTTAAKTTAAKTTAAKTAAARTTPAKATAAKSTAAKTAAAKAAAAKTAETKSAARTAAARTAAAKTAAAKAAAAKSAASKAAANAAEDAETVIAPVQLPDASVETVNIEAPAPAPAAETVSAVVVAEEEAAPATEVADPAGEVPVVDSIIQDVHAAADDDAAADEGDTAVDSAADQQREITDTGASATARVVAEVHEASDTAAISIRGLVKHFGDNHAVDGIDLTVPAGSFYGIVGPNGAGKTTTLSIVAGLLRADAGTVAICGIDQASQPLAAKRVMGVLPDRLRTFDRLTGRQLLYYYGLLRGLAPSVIEKRTADLARAFDLQEALSRVVSDYSAGMTKKLMLAGAMIHSPRVLVLDEPFESVDPVSSAVILDILRAYVSHGGTVILSSHGMDLVERVCSRVAIIVGGEVLAEGTIDEVRAGQTLEARFVELSGGIGEVEGLEWLHMFSD
ncbi:ABC transporter ATP-binding protein [Microbacterium sp. NPDC087591]|uniref:ABC transporter ATP-binding protein n=1 Tax=Microbacterium sp. NPDC087591 TaxID=3364192 RepID=UPI0037FF09AA